MDKIDLNDIVSIRQNDQLFYCVKSLEKGDWIPILVCQPSSNKIIVIDGIRYRDDRYITISSNEDICSILPKEKLFMVIKDAIIFITSKGLLVDVPSDDYYLNSYLSEMDNVSLVKDVACFPYDGEIPLTDKTMTRLCIEKPVRKACISLQKNGIETLMSSANEKNVMTRDEPVDEKRLYIGFNDSWVIGNGYAWIMLDWDKLCYENKKYLISIKNNELNLELSEKEIECLRYNSIINGKKGTQSELIKFYEYVDVQKDFIESCDYDCKKIFKNIILSPASKDDLYDPNKIYLFGHNSLNNHAQQNGANHFRTVAIRYPLSNDSTVEDVEAFYNKIVLQMIKNENKYKVNSSQSLS